jgi:hypothetical protein
MNLIPTKRTDLKVGNVVLGKGDQRQYKIEQMMPGMAGRNFPYLTLSCEGEIFEHDTSWDSYNITYDVIENPLELPTKLLSGEK